MFQYPGDMQGGPADPVCAAQQHLLHPNVRGVDGAAGTTQKVSARPLLEDRGHVLPLAAGHGVHVELVRRL